MHQRVSWTTGEAEIRQTLRLLATETLTRQHEGSEMIWTLRSHDAAQRVHFFQTQDYSECSEGPTEPTWHSEQLQLAPQQSCLGPGSHTHTHTHTHTHKENNISLQNTNDCEVGETQFVIVVHKWALSWSCSLVPDVLSGKTCAENSTREELLLLQVFSSRLCHKTESINRRRSDTSGHIAASSHTAGHRQFSSSLVFYLLLSSSISIKRSKYINVSLKLSC